MQVITYSKSRDKLAKVIDDVVDNNETVVITKNNKSAVMISLDEYNSWKETEYLMQYPKNVTRLLKAIANVESGNMTKKELLDD